VNRLDVRAVEAHEDDVGQVAGGEAAQLALLSERPRALTGGHGQRVAQREGAGVGALVLLEHR
jgi:hypothetical protein